MNTSYLNKHKVEWVGNHKITGTMGHLPNTQNCGLRMRRERRERFPCHRRQGKPLISDPDMHHHTCVTHVPWCMSGSLTRGGGENVPGIPGACATLNFTYLARGPWPFWARHTKPASEFKWDLHATHPQKPMEISRIDLKCFVSIRHPTASTNYRKCSKCQHERALVCLIAQCLKPLFCCVLPLNIGTNYNPFIQVPRPCGPQPTDADLGRFAPGALIQTLLTNDKQAALSQPYWRNTWLKENPLPKWIMILECAQQHDVNKDITATKNIWSMRSGCHWISTIIILSDAWNLWCYTRSPWQDSPKTDCRRLSL